MVWYADDGIESGLLMQGSESVVDGAAGKPADPQRVGHRVCRFSNKGGAEPGADRETAIAEIAKDLLPVLDDPGRAEAHGDLEGTEMELIGQKLRPALDHYGLAAIGCEGNAFNPKLHKAITSNRARAAKVGGGSDRVRVSAP